MAVSRSQVLFHQRPSLLAYNRCVCAAPSWLERGGRWVCCLELHASHVQTRPPCAQSRQTLHVFPSLPDRSFAGASWAVGLSSRPAPLNHVALRRVSEAPPRTGCRSRHSIDLYCIPRNPQRTVLVIGPASLLPRLSNQAVPLCFVPLDTALRHENECRTDGDPHKSPAINGAEVFQRFRTSKTTERGTGDRASRTSERSGRNGVR
ncbi:hypothetical protein C8T65DRAFT_185043 [Cerioporus squamosus]|nr:hypothetical protein C8T65DRAFT_185043 [Cerioporus squamosus]